MFLRSYSCFSKEDLKATKKTIKLSKELSDLVTCCKSVRFENFANSAEDRKYGINILDYFKVYDLSRTALLRFFLM